MDLTDKAVLITGASRGIGRATALRFGEEGSTVVVNFKSSKEKAEEVAREIEDRGGEAVVSRADISDPEQCEELIGHAEDYYDGIDILVNNAGIAAHRPFDKTGPGTIKEMVDTNLTGLMLLTRHALPEMKERDEGIIVNISSGAGKKGFADMAPYCATKFGVLGFTEALGAELAGTGVNTYAICPGVVDTDMARDLFGDMGSSHMIDPDKIARYVVAVCTGKKEVSNGGSVNVYS